MTRGDILAVVGAQYGSEGKGNFVYNVRNDYAVHVRVGGPNAGHSFRHEGRVHKMQSLPCGWSNPNALLVLGRGMLISPEQLFKELQEVAELDHFIYDRVRIDSRAGILSPWHHATAGGVRGEAHQRYGSTGEGVGVARVARIQRHPGKHERDTGFYHAGELPPQCIPPKMRGLWNLMLTDDTPALLQSRNKQGDNILLEGTQGSALSLIHGPWPFVTNHDTNAAQLAADCGLPPSLVNRCLLVMRTFPIRVAGNSGPMVRELTWEEMSRRVGKPVTEQTTVTKKTRRIGDWDESLIAKACTLNGPTSLAISFMDYLCPEDEGKTDAAELSDRAHTFIDYVQRITDSAVRMVGTGGANGEWNVVRFGGTGIRL